ncbi:MAG: SH3 domain-containing protein [Synergistaceae bacterium]|nr:SH3 domain-containing protein [Synergistaceae bacterium]
MNGFFCQKCGAPGYENDVFCRKCGAKHQSEAKKQDCSTDDSVKFCANCGSLMRHGANFCDNCGSENGQYAGARSKAGIEKRGAGSRRGYRYMFALLFLIAAGFAAYKYYSGNFSFTEIIAAIKRQTRSVPEPFDGGSPPPADEISSDEPARDSDEKPRDAVESDELSESDDTRDTLPLSVEAHEFPVPDTTPVSEERALQEVQSGANAPDNPEYVWAVQDASGYSTLAAADRFFTSAQIPSAIGAVSGDRVRLRSNHSLKGRIVGQFDNGASFDVVRRYSSGNEKFCWYEVRSGDVTGWIYGEFLKIPGVKDDSPIKISEDVRLIVTSSEPYVSSAELSP